MYIYLYYTTKSRNSEKTSFCAWNSEKVWTDSEHSEHWLKILNKFWTFWTLIENSEQILNILNIDWTFSEYSEQYLNRFWTFWTLSENSEHCLKSLNRVWTFYLNISYDILSINYFFKSNLQYIQNFRSSPNVLDVGNLC